MQTATYNMRIAAYNYNGQGSTEKSVTQTKPLKVWIAQFLNCAPDSAGFARLDGLLEAALLYQKTGKNPAFTPPGEGRWYFSG